MALSGSASLILRIHLRYLSLYVIISGLSEIVLCLPVFHSQTPFSLTIAINVSCRKEIHLFFKLKQDFLQNGRNILLIQIMNDSSDDTNIKVIQLSKSYLCFTSFSFINNLSGRNDFPHGIFANTCCSSCFCYYCSCPKLWLISTFTLFLKILCDIQYYLLLLHTNRFSVFLLGTPWKWRNDVSHLPVVAKGKLAGAWATFYNRRHQLSNKFLCLCCQWRPLLCQTY